MAFEGFRPEALDFLFENRLKDSKSWFEEHRGDYERLLLTPLRALVEELAPVMLGIDPEFTVIPAVNKTISRIYRDTRFSHDKSLFRSEVWITFMRKKKFWEGLPGFNFLFNPREYLIGVGYYEVSKPSLEAFREMVLHQDKAFLQLRKAYEGQNEFVLNAERYRRSKFPGQPEELRRWLDLKNISFEARFDDLSPLFSKDFASELAAAFLRLRPEYDFIRAIEGRARRGETR